MGKVSVLKWKSKWVIRWCEMIGRSNEKYRGGIFLESEVFMKKIGFFESFEGGDLLSMDEENVLRF